VPLALLDCFFFTGRLPSLRSTLRLISHITSSFQGMAPKLRFKHRQESWQKRKES
jgi:hypothetical protein